MAKAKDAFRTISEVAEWLDTPTHVLRFWESKFTQIKPVKGAGGRRYYRPADMELLGGIKQLLHEDGLTIKGTQKLLREQGVKHVASLGPSPNDQEAPTEAQAAATSEPSSAPPVAATPQQPAAEHAQTALPFDEPAPQQADSILDQYAPPRVPPVALPRLIGRAPVDTSGLRQRAAQIAPLLDRLETLRARMVG
ncbi:MAG: MerR family transcriptional regulator [Yoonia sp.]|uniref:MerR family transcriptional regulator n=1 Tax=Yoonia sp. TaxID=2212373 RepID=UPI003EF4122C